MFPDIIKAHTFAQRNMFWEFLKNWTCCSTSTKIKKMGNAIKPGSLELCSLSVVFSMQPPRISFFSTTLLYWHLSTWYLPQNTSIICVKLSSTVRWYICWPYKSFLLASCHEPWFSLHFHDYFKCIGRKFTNSKYCVAPQCSFIHNLRSGFDGFVIVVVLCGIGDGGTAFVVVVCLNDSCLPVMWKWICGCKRACVCLFVCEYVMLYWPPLQCSWC